jgi:hypothetical protein
LLWGRTYPWRCRPVGRSSDRATDAPCHAPDLAGLHRLDRTRQGPFPHTVHQPPWLSEPGATSTDGSHLPHPLLALRVRLRGRHCCLGLAALAQLPITRSPASLRARSSRLAGYSPERPGHVPSIDFCNCMDSQARPRATETPPLLTVASHRTVGGVALARRHQLGWYSPGVARSRRSLQRPPRRPSRRFGFSPTCRTPDTPCRSPAPAAVRKKQRRATKRMPSVRRRRAWPLPAARTNPQCRCGRTSSPGSPRRSAARLVGPPPAYPRESVDSQPHPRCLPPKRPPPPFGRRQQGASQPWVSRAGRTASTPLLPVAITTLTRSR